MLNTGAAQLQPLALLLPTPSPLVGAVLPRPLLSPCVAHLFLASVCSASGTALAAAPALAAETAAARSIAGCG